MKNNYQNNKNDLQNDLYSYNIHYHRPSFQYKKSNRNAYWKNTKAEIQPSNQFQEPKSQIQEQDNTMRVSTSIYDVRYEDRKRESKIQREIPEIKEKKDKQKLSNIFQEHEIIKTIFDDSMLLIDNIKDVQIQHQIYFGAYFTNFVKYLYLQKFFVEIKCSQCKQKFNVESKLLRSTKAPGIKITHCNKQVEIIFVQCKLFLLYDFIEFQQQKIQFDQKQVIGGLISKLDDIEIKLIEALFYVICQCDNNQIRLMKMERDKSREQLENDSKNKYLFQDECYRQLCKYCSREPQIQGGQLIMQIV